MLWTLPLLRWWLLKLLFRYVLCMFNHYIRLAVISNSIPAAYFQLLCAKFSINVFICLLFSYCFDIWSEISSSWMNLFRISLTTSYTFQHDHHVYNFDKLCVHDIQQSSRMVQTSRVSILSLYVLGVIKNGSDSESKKWCSFFLNLSDTPSRGSTHSSHSQRLWLEVSV